MKRMLIIFSGYNQRAVIAFLRTLERNKIDEYCIIASSEDDTILLTDYRNKVDYVRKIKQLDLKEITTLLRNIKEKRDVDELVIVPSTEGLNRFILTHREILENEGCIIPLVNRALYEQISDKESFYKVCLKQGIKVPQIIDFPKVFSDRFVAKPKKYISKDGNVYSPILVLNEEEYERFTQNYSIDLFDYQEYVDGESYYLLYYFNKDGDIYKYSQKNYVQQPGGKSIIAAEGTTIHNDEISHSYESLIKKMNYHGFIMIEVRKHNGDYYMIEANPRLWGPSQLFVDAKVPIFEGFLKEMRFIDELPQIEENKSAKYFWSTGAKSDILADDKIAWYGNAREYIAENMKKCIEYDMYNRIDTKRVYLAENKCN